MTALTGSGSTEVPGELRSPLGTMACMGAFERQLAETDAAARGIFGPGADAATTELRTLSPLDERPRLKRVTRTAHRLIVGEPVAALGARAAEIIMCVRESASCVPDGSVQHFVALARTVTTRRALEAEASPTCERIAPRVAAVAAP